MLENYSNPFLIVLVEGLGELIISPKLRGTEETFYETFFLLV